ncbi:MAG TPA: nuclear transport factor 2 family protein [Pyrinomonadaceae bacterium]
MKRLLAIGILISSAAVFAFGECSDLDKKALESFDRAWGQAGEKGDKNALMAIYADDYTGLPGMLNKTRTIETTMATFEENKANPQMADVVTHDNYFISCTAASATITHRNIITTRVGTGGKEETFWTRSVHVLEKRGDRWQVVSNAGNGLDEYAVIGYMEMDWNNAVKTRDWTWMEKNFAPDFSDISSSSGKLMNKKESIEDSKGDKAKYFTVDTQGMNIRIDGNMAVVTGTFHLKGQDEKGQSVERSLRFTDTYIRRDGRWQVWASQGTALAKQ